MSDIFTKLPAWKLFSKCAFPNMISASFLAFYYIVDGIFVGKYLGNNALAALGLVLPFIIMSFAIADTIGVGSAVQISMKLGKNQKEEAKTMFSACIVIILAFSFLMGFIEYFLGPLLIDLLNVSKEVKELCKEILIVFALFAPITMISFALDNYLRICGKTFYSMIINIIIALSNLFFDYLFIVVLGWGVFSAALATCIGLSLGGIFGILPFLIQNLELKFTKIALSFKEFKNIIYNGSSEFFNNVSTSLFSIFANLVLLNLAGTKGVAAFSIILYINTFIISLLISMCDAMQPALSFNYAKKDIKRVKNLIIPILISAFIFSITILFIVLTFKENLISFFSKDKNKEFLDFGSHALMIFSFNYLIIWINVLSTSFLTAFNKPKSSLIISLNQNLFIPLIFLFILPLFLNLNGVWLTPLMANIFVLILSFIFLRKIFAK
ncbi:MATE family efflux transporter [Campylobacter novaezeelandiae]|uniref:Multidrug-efflux transporter n=2 Tax=Campylobacter novaezeelandiae TaxID=2267891 RepID=A0A4Q9JT06_9BACT|nr:MATE family efflux transporter [Campylobacter novaezeelandiae]MBK1964505.1 MATE family efflux transporter [Campylobacter novaezeelandiae]TBR79664.1 MATE family efflux transporter [Campylobacter novaezeelandiae]